MYLQCPKGNRTRELGRRPSCFMLPYSLTSQIPFEQRIVTST